MKRIIFFSVISIFVFTSCKNSKSNLTEYVNPFIGTAGHGHTFPGATVPFGMVQLSPDTHTEGWDWCSGYHYSDSSIIGFSHTHLSGTGRGELLDVLFMPFTGETNFEAGTRENPEKGYRSPFSHKNEIASPGYYKVLLDKYKIEVELTASTRAGFHQYSYPEKSEQKVMIDLFHSLKSDIISYGNLKIVNDSLIVGSRKSRGWGEKQEKDWVNHEVFFAARFSKKINDIQLFVDGKLADNKTDATGKDVKVALTFQSENNQPLQSKVGISEVDIDGALKNVDTEIANWDFAEVKQQAEQKWEKILQSFTVKSDNREKLETFYTALYHSCIAPYTYSDTDKRYRGFDKQIHTADNFTNYTGLSLWDTFRALNPLLTIVQPQMVPDMINSMLAQYDQYGLLPIWPLCSSETNCMIGYHSIPVIADAYFKGIKGFDVNKAYEAMKTSAMQDTFGIQFLKKYNYIPTDLENKSVSKTLEYAYDDWCIAQMAKALGKTEDYAYFTKRSQAYRNVFDKNTQFMRGKNAKGNFVEPFDPTFASYEKCDFVEGNSWQYSLFVPHDVPGLIEIFGGKQALANKIDALFTVETSSLEGKPIDVSGLIGEYAHGNEPSHHVAYLYNFVDQPWKTQERIHEIMSTLYSNKPDGLCGNEDMGQMSAWYVFSVLGFYPVNPADGKYVFGTPEFAEVAINLPNKRTFAVKAKNFGDKNIYIEKVKLNGKDYNNGSITHQQLLEGGKLEFTMSDKKGMVFSMNLESFLE
ncbi:MAG: alpha-mannosidase [Porphyromonadaceae bacterium CG2_30_38_12]|nr:MAG: alpha-mannosidase [Porphyromonadaceae bacterium CG2_30_38_12]